MIAARREQTTLIKEVSCIADPPELLIHESHWLQLLIPLAIIISMLLVVVVVVLMMPHVLLMDYIGERSWL